MTDNGKQGLISQNGTRRYDVDGLRVFAFGLLILYHVGMFYVADWHWHVKSNYSFEPLQIVMKLVNPWRMPLVFLISGVAVHFLLRKLSPINFAWARTKRLLIPLLLGMVVIVPPQAYLQAIANGAFEGSYLTFLWHYFTFQTWSVGAFDGSEYGITWNHLWYLPYLLSYSLVVALLLPLLRSRRCEALVTGFHSLRGWQLLILPALPFLLYEWLLNERFPVTYAWYNDWDCHAVSFTAFFLGYLLGRGQGAWKELQRLRWLTLALAIATYLWLVLIHPHVELPGIGETLVGAILPTYNGWFWLITVLGWGHHLLNRPFRWLPYATEAIYPWYVLHQTIIVVAGYYLGHLYLGPIVEPVLVLAATVIWCLLLNELVIRRVRFLRPLFGMKELRRCVPVVLNQGKGADLA